MEFEQAKIAFESYLAGYDREDEKVYLKIVHTYGVVACSEEIARRMGLDEENIFLAKMIALLHDIGRFEQLRLYDSFDPGVFDHAQYGADILFREGRIREFLPERTWDEIIEKAIRHHSAFQLPEIADEKILLHAKLIRDADKLDNCRVKLDERVEVLLGGVSAQEAGRQEISEEVWNACLEGHSVLSKDRKTSLDYWVSYVAYFFDIYFTETLQIIHEQSYVEKVIDRIPYENLVSNKRMQELKKHVIEYIIKRVTKASKQ